MKILILIFWFGNSNRIEYDNITFYNLRIASEEKKVWLCCVVVAQQKDHLSKDNSEKVDYGA